LGTDSLHSKINFYLEFYVCSDETFLFRTREKETSERRREMKAKETAVKFYKEKVT